MNLLWDDDECILNIIESKEKCKNLQFLTVVILNCQICMPHQFVILTLKQNL